MTAVDARESLKGIAARARTKTRPIRLSIRIVWDTLARILPSAPTEEPLDPQRLPEDLRDLFPLLARWAVSDDLERSDLVADATTAALQELVDRAEPRLPRIASFLAGHGDEDSAEAF